MSTGALWGSLFVIEEKFLIYFIIFGEQASIFGPHANVLNMVVKTVFDVSTRTLWGYFFEQKLLSLLIMFGHWAKDHRPHGKIFSAFWRICSRGLSELHSMCPGKYFEGTFVLNFLTLSDTEQNFSGFCQNQCWRGLSKLHSKRPELHSEWEKFEGFTNLIIIFGFWPKILLAFRPDVFGRDCHFCILRVQKEMLKENVVFQNFIFWSFSWR